MRYIGLPPGDHSVEVEGLGRFAPEGSYAHDAGRGLGDEDDDEVFLARYSVSPLKRIKFIQNPA